MSILARVLHFVRSELDAIFEPDTWPGDPSTGRRQADSASSEHGARRTQSTQGVGEAQDPILAGYYANLELPYGASLDTVRRTWRRLVKKYHPDLHSADEQARRTATELVQGLNRAYEELAAHLKRH